jgi:glucoamylase
MGIKRPNDPTIANSLLAYDTVIERMIGSSNYPAWFRYNFDGYGETNAGDPPSGHGRLWPIFDAERGNYQIAATGTGSAGSPYLAALKAFSTAQGFISEQIFNSSTSLAGAQLSGSMEPVMAPGVSPGGVVTATPVGLSQSQGEYITLLANVAAGKVLDIPQAVCVRYFACAQVEVDINVNAVTQWGQYVYVTGNTEALGNWNTNLSLPVDPASYPVWKNAINLAAGGVVQYKYYRKNTDGSVTWECYPIGSNCNGNRSLTAPSSGSFSVNDTVSWQ